MMISNLPADLLEEILSRVPATSMIRLRSTCKQWYNLFKDQMFAEKHLRNVPKQLRVITLKENRLFLPSVDLNFVPPFIEFSDVLSLNNSSNSEEVHMDSWTQLFTAMVYCYAPPGRMNSWFGILV
ncbi:hypothetical protein F2Q70_00021153 [Brassica cretica]|uniref:F-box domain-containing protein n=1 Tax=Brassica cretica TaxID=69181 RepID=A0A3N6RBR0_BRACR|nr:hypothetical protein F2Q70_00021153 [Brassica cretica]KAF3608528.1 hypothetical protein DY000_02047234 [Brassica cretica]